MSKKKHRKTVRKKFSPTKALIVLSVTIAITLIGLLIHKIAGGFLPADDSVFEYVLKNRLPLISIPDEDKKDLLKIAVGSINDYFTNKNQNSFPRKYDVIPNPVIVVLRVKGQERGRSHAYSKNMAQSVYGAVRKILSDKSTEEPLSRFDAPNIKVHIYVTGDFRPHEKNYVRGIHGMLLRNGSKELFQHNTFPIEHNYKSQKCFEIMCQDADLNSACFDNPNTERLIFNTVHFGSSRFPPYVATYHRGNVVELDITKNVTMKRVRESLASARQWIVDNVRDDGAFSYIYNPSQGQYPNKNNMIRQLMTSRVLAEMSQTNRDLRDLHQKNLDCIFDRWYYEDGENGYIYFNNRSKLGAIAMALRTLIYSPFFPIYQSKAEKLLNGLLSLQRSDGSFTPWYVRPESYKDSSRDDYLLTFYSGEALLAMVEYYEKTGDKKILKATRKSQDFYVKRYAYELRKNYYPAYVPWHAQSLNKLYKITRDPVYAEAMMIMNDELLKIQNQDGVPYKDLQGRFYNPLYKQYGSPHSSSDAVYTEGLAYAYEIAKLIGDSVHVERYGKAIALGVHNIMNLQYKGPDTYYMAYPKRVLGAIRYHVMDNRIRNDTSQHMSDAFSKIVAILSDDELRHYAAKASRPL